MDDHNVFIKFCQKHNVPIEGEFPDCWVPSNTLAEILEMKKIRSTLQFYPEEYKKLKKTLTVGGAQTSLWISYAGFKMLVANSRKPKARCIAEELKLGIGRFHCVSVESETISFIRKAFEGEATSLQHAFGRYRVDLYFKDYKLVVECDEENTHNSKEKRSYDLKRQKYIEDHFACTFVRYRPQSDKDALPKIINQIYIHIMKNKTDALR
jgi:very-short-patch-repair endonuclease